MPARVLIVEDEEATAHFLSEWLAQLGYEAQLSDTGFEALAQLRVAHPAALIVDLMLPGMGGWELVRRIREDTGWQNLPIIICTARPDIAPLGLVQGMLRKPFRLEELAQALRVALAH